MAVIIEITIEAEKFSLGKVTQLTPGVHVELERLVPTGNEVMPFFWAEGENLETFERRIRNENIVEELSAVTRVGDQVLYHVVWSGAATALTDILASVGATILEAKGNSPWTFKLRFQDHRGVRDFHNECQAAGIDFHVQRLYTLDEQQDARYSFGLTAEQQAALVTALERGYFHVPRDTTLEEIAAELDITPQAASERVRRGANTVLRSVLLEQSTADLR